ncbi:MAG: histone deacetylase family protein [Promethearchaeota archaeon]
MTENKKLGIVIDKDFALKHVPPYHKPTFLAFENPLRIKVILDLFDKLDLFKDQRIIRMKPKEINESVLQLAHTKYYIDAIKRISNFGYGFLGEEIFIDKNTFNIAKKAVGGAIKAVESVLNKEVDQSIALIRPPGHHALREISSGLCIFNNIVISILYLRQILKYQKKIAIIDIDDHFGDGIVQYFYKDPSILYFSVHEFDFNECDLGFLTELGDGEGLGKTINFPIPTRSTDLDFIRVINFLELILNEFRPDFIIIATGFDMYFDDPIGNCNLTSISYYNFAKKIRELADQFCEGRLAFILEGGYSLIGLPFCVLAIIKGLFNETYEHQNFEVLDCSKEMNIKEIEKVKSTLIKLLKPYWTTL